MARHCKMTPCTVRTANSPKDTHLLPSAISPETTEQGARCQTDEGRQEERLVAMEEDIRELGAAEQKDEIGREPAPGDGVQKRSEADRREDWIESSRKNAQVLSNVVSKKPRTG